MADTNPKLPLTGKDIAVTVFVGGVPQQQTDLCKSVSVDEVVTQFRDDYLNRDAQRTDEQTDGVDVKLSLDYASSTLVTALIAAKEARRLRQPVKEISIGLVLQDRDGNYHGYLIQKCSSKYAFSFSGRKERGVQTIDLQAETCKPQVF